ncbi:hypothetical protein CEXT_501241 [Caerostris extrusa]|uniref:Uncharacterized protein n=1 Tax=Caerostris extrusa TaxID=172846 RepID=A0AAV4RWI2_CAEEX|nr:hypothetical protein CEXT_501241 [Caerostris extrusa]
MSRQAIEACLSVCSMRHVPLKVKKKKKPIRVNEMPQRCKINASVFAFLVDHHNILHPVSRAKNEERTASFPGDPLAKTIRHSSEGQGAPSSVLFFCLELSVKLPCLRGKKGACHAKTGGYHHFGHHGSLPDCACH